MKNTRQVKLFKATYHFSKKKYGTEEFLTIIDEEVTDNLTLI